MLNFKLSKPFFRKRPKSYGWKFWALWQYTSRGRVRGIRGFVDLNYTPMDLRTLRKYGKPYPDFDCEKLEKDYQKAKKEYKRLKKLRKEEC